jgi:hypothetical protein
MDKFRHTKSPSLPIMSKHAVNACPAPTALFTPKLAPANAKVAFADPAPVEIDGPQTPKITNLCSTIAGCSSDLPKYGCLKDEARQYLIEPLCCANKEPQKYVTLDTLLSKSSPISLSRRQRFQVALILASSHIQLHPTPWLKSKWSKRDVLFLYDTEDSTKIGSDQPYISRSLSKSLQQSGRNIVISTDIYSFQDSIRNLGIMLLELCFGTAIEDHKLRQNINTSDEQILQLFNYTAAIQWSRDVVEEAGPEYADAITWCLHHIPESGVEGKDEKWREDMFNKVVEPLKSCHDQLITIKGKNVSLV